MKIGNKVKVVKDQTNIKAGLKNSLLGEKGVIVDISNDLFLVDLPNSKWNGGFAEWMRLRMDNKGKDLTNKTTYFNEDDLCVL